MAGVAIKVLAGDVLARLKSMEDRGDNLSGVMRAFGGYMVGSIQKNFDAEGRPVKWQPLKIATLLGWSYGYKRGGAYRTKKGGPTKKGREALAGRKILTASTRLRRSVRVIRSTAASVEIGTDATAYAAIHQFGGLAGRGKKTHIPARPYLLFQDEDVAHANRMVAAYVMNGRII